MHSEERFHFLAQITTAKNKIQLFGSKLICMLVAHWLGFLLYYLQNQSCVIRIPIFSVVAGCQLALTGETRCATCCRDVVQQQRSCRLWNMDKNSSKLNLFPL